MKYALILLSGLAAISATPAHAAPECWNFDFRAADFRNSSPAQAVVTGSFTLTIDWAKPVGGATLPSPDSVDVSIAGHSFSPAELQWSYLPVDERIILQPAEPLEDKEFFVSAGRNQMFLMVDRPRTAASPAVFVYSVERATTKWLTTNVSVSARRCGIRHIPNVIQKFRRPTYIICDIGKDVIGRPRWRSVSLRNRGRRILPAGTALTYSTSGGDVETIRLQRDLLPGAAVAGLSSRAGSCTVEAVTPAR